MKHQCPACRYPGLSEPPRSPTGGASFEICPCCGFEFGVTDDDAGLSYAAWRKRWKDGGMRWWSRSRPAPSDWDPAEQLTGGKAGKTGKVGKGSGPAKSSRRS